MKRFFIVILIIILLVGSFFIIYDYRSEQKQYVSRYSLTNNEINLIHDGDIILRHGFGIVSNAIVNTFNPDLKVSHCAIICKYKNDFYVVHSISSSLSDIDGIQFQDLKSFIRESKKNSVRIIRYKPRIDKPLSCISSRAYYYLKQQIPFDHGFDLKDSSEFYCTELLWKIILDEFQEDIFPARSSDNIDHLRLDPFFDTARFQVILNHHIRKNKSS